MDRSGTRTDSDFTAVIRNLSESLDGEGTEADTLFDILDQDNDDRISIDEMILYDNASGQSEDLARSCFAKVSNGAAPLTRHRVHEALVEFYQSEDESAGGNDFFGEFVSLKAYPNLLFSPRDLLSRRNTLPTEDCLSVFRAMVTSKWIDQACDVAINAQQAAFHLSTRGHELSALLGPLLNDSDWLHPHYRNKALLLARGMTVRSFFDMLLCTADSNSLVHHVSLPEAKHTKRCHARRKQRTAIGWRRGGHSSQA